MIVANTEGMGGIWGLRFRCSRAGRFDEQAVLPVWRQFFLFPATCEGTCLAAVMGVFGEHSQRSMD